MTARPSAWFASLTTSRSGRDGGRIKKNEGNNQDYTDTTYIGSLYKAAVTRTTADSQTTQTKHIFAGANRVCSVTQDAGPMTQYAFYHSDHLEIKGSGLNNQQNH